MNLISRLIFQDSAAHHHPNPHPHAHCSGCLRACDDKLGCERCNLHHLRRGLLLLLCDGLWPHPQHSMLRDLPDSGPGALHRDLCPRVLDLRHHCHLHSPGHAHLHRPCRRLWDLCSRMRDLVDLCVPEGPRDQRDAARGHHRVLLGRGKASIEARLGWKQCCWSWFLMFLLGVK